MKALLFRAGAGLAAAAGAVGLLAAGGRAEEFAPEAGYTALFNGKDLTGFKYKNQALAGKTETADGRFQVVDGAIVTSDAAKADPQMLAGVGEFNRNFVLKLEFRAAAKAGGGVSVRGNVLRVRDFLRRGEQKALASVFKNDDWNELEIAVTNNVLVSKVNGKTLAPTDTLELTVKDGKPVGKLNGQELENASIDVARGPAAVCKLNGTVFEPTFKPGAKGGIGLQAENGKLEFRRVRIKESD